MISKLQRRRRAVSRLEEAVCDLIRNAERFSTTAGPSDTRNQRLWLLESARDYAARLAIVRKLG